MKGMRRIALALGAAALLALGAMTASAAPASAAATVTIDYFTVSSSDAGEPLIDECRPGLTATIFFGTTEFRYETVETTEGFHFNGTETFTARIDWSDGSYSLIKGRDHFLFTTRFGGTTVFTLPHVDTVLTYSAEGEFLSGNSLHHVEHFTVTGDGEVRVDFDRFHFVFFGGC